MATNIEKYFKDSLIRRFDQIQELKQQIAREQVINAKKEKAKKALLEKHKQSKSSQKLVQTFKRSVEAIRSQKEETRRANFKQTDGVPRPVVSKEDLNAAEKRRVLEAFVENDDALGLLLDFISNKHLKKPGEPPAAAAGASGQSTATDMGSQGAMAHTMRSGMGLANTGSQPNNFQSTGHSGSLIQNMIGGGGADGS